MKPIYLPFTYISKPVIQALCACFRQTVVYQPSDLKIPAEMHKWTESGVLDIRIPVEGDEDKLAAILKDYENWANPYQKGTLDYLKVRRDSTPFFDKEATSQIRADIKEKSRQSLPRDESEELLNARMFLHIAQDFDLQNNKLNQDLLTLEGMEQNLISDLKGEDKVLLSETSLKHRFQIEDPGLYMTAERLRSWIRLGQYDQKASGLYMTTSRSVFDELMDCDVEPEMIVAFDAVPVCENKTTKMQNWQNDLLENLNKLLTNPWPQSTDEMFKPPVVNEDNRTVAIKFYIIAGETPQKFLIRCVEGHPLPTKDEKIFKNTIIGIIEF